MPESKASNYKLQRVAIASSSRPHVGPKRLGFIIIDSDRAVRSCIHRFTAQMVKT